MKKYCKAGLPALLLLYCCLTVKAVSPADGGSFGFQEIRMVEDHSAVLVDWLKKGIQGAVLVHVDAHGDLGELLPAKAKHIAQLAASGDVPGLRKGDRPGHGGLYHCGNFLRAAIVAQMIKTIWWVTPFDWFGEQGAGPVMKERLAAEGWSAEGLDSLRFEEGSFSGREFGVEFHICSLSSLPSNPDPDPLILSIDTDFIPAHAAVRKQPGLVVAEELARLLLQKEYKPLDVSIAYSVNGDYTPALKRWLGEALRDMLRTAGRPVKQPLWEILQQADGLAETGSPRDLIVYLDSLPSSLRSNFYCFQYLADAHYLENDISGAFDRACLACRFDKGCCAVLSRIGYGLAIESRVEEAERFMREIVKRNPDYQDWQADLETALAWNEKGEYAKAIFFLEKISRQYRFYSAEFLIGDMFLKQNRLKPARARFDRALSYLQAACFDEIMRPEIAAAVSRAADFYERLGLRAKSQTLRAHPRLVKVFSADDRR